MATPTKVAKLPTNGASPVVQFSKPGTWPLLMMPNRISTPVIRKATTASTLISANQYSASAKPRAENAFSPTISSRNRPLQRMPGTLGNQ